jgi:hypothetical protein
VGTAQLKIKIFAGGADKRGILDLGKDLTEFSLDTVKMFHRDALAAGYRF